MTPYEQGYYRTLKLAGYSEEALAAIKEASRMKRVMEAMSQPWQEGLVSLGDEVATMVPAFGRGADEAAEAARKVIPPPGPGRRSIPVDPRMRTYGGAFQ